jgi:hypothetical protein
MGRLILRCHHLLQLEFRSSVFLDRHIIGFFLKTARRTVFALMGAGLHGLNGVNPKVGIHLIQIYVMPRLLYGLEITTLRHNEIQKLEIMLVLKTFAHL